MTAANLRAAWERDSRVRNPTTKTPSEPAWTVAAEREIATLQHAARKVEARGVAAARAALYLGSAGVGEAEHLADFMEHVNGNTTKELGRHHGWEGKLWHDRYHMIPISDEEEVQIAQAEWDRLRAR